MPPEPLRVSLELPVSAGVEAVANTGIFGVGGDVPGTTLWFGPRTLVPASVATWHRAVIADASMVAMVERSVTTNVPAVNVQNSGILPS